MTNKLRTMVIAAMLMSATHAYGYDDEYSGGGWAGDLLREFSKMDGSYYDRDRVEERQYQQRRRQNIQDQQILMDQYRFQQEQRPPVSCNVFNGVLYCR